MAPGKELLGGDEYARIGDAAAYIGDGVTAPNERFPSKTNWLRLWLLLLRPMVDRGGVILFEYSVCAEVSSSFDIGGMEFSLAL